MLGSRRPFVLGRGSWPEASRVAEILRRETLGGALLGVATLIALVWANSPWSREYDSVRGYVVGPSPLHLDLTLSAWAADGLLALFFFVAGLELKREFVAGDLRDPRRALVPVSAAVGGVIVPAGVYLAVNAGGAVHGWAIPTATDIAFALAALAVVGASLPSALRTFLLTLAVVDDLIAIVIIAVFYTESVTWWALGAAVLPLALFTVFVQRGTRSWWLLLPLALLTWALVHTAGIHATVAGVLLAFAVPVRPAPGASDGAGVAERFEHTWRPVSAGVAVPLFALLSAGVHVGGLRGLGDALSEPVALGVLLGLVVGKPVGVLGATWVVARFTHADLDPDLRWLDVVALALLCGIGCTVSLLIGELAFGGTAVQLGYVKVGILLGSLLAAVLASVLLRARSRVYRQICSVETVDADHDGVPDVFRVQA